MRRTAEDIQDEWLVLRCQDGDAEALSVLIPRWQPRLARLAWRLTGDREAARDLAQEAWLAIVRGLRRLDDPARFRTWAYRIVRHKCADWVRRREVRRRASWDLQTRAMSADGCGDDDSDSADDLSRLRRALARMPDDQRVILSLRYLDEMSVGAIARLLEVPEGTVKSRLYHARNRLRDVFEREST